MHTDTVNASEETLSELEKYKSLYRDESTLTQEQAKRIADLQRELDEMKHTVSWRITAPMRFFYRVMMKIPPVRMGAKVLKNIRRFGFRYTYKKARTMMRLRKLSRGRIVYTEEALEAQRREKFDTPPLFSVIVPLYNTPIDFLKEMIDSVICQTYSNFELCLVDGSDSGHPEVGELCISEAEKDSRIKYKRLDKNLGISGNTNAAIEMASGDYIALFDHDDKLHPAALYETAKAALDGADFIYTDEAKFLKDEKKDAYDFYYKPDFSPDLLRSYNYICHFTAFSRRLLENVGGFRSDFDGSQDYDMILRLTEVAEKITHIPTVLYYWRTHSASVASDVGAKPYTVAAAKKALAEHLSRIGQSGEVEDSSIPSSYRIKYRISDSPKVSILIPTKDHVSDLRCCLESVYGRTTYKNFEVVLIENNSTEDATFEFYKEAEEKYHDLKIVKWESAFNYSKINNFGAEHATGEYFILLNNDIEIITPEWIEEMLMFVQRDDVGAAGMMLYYSDQTVQHAGVVLGIGGVAGHAHKNYKRGDKGYFWRMTVAQNYSAVTAAAMMIKSSVYKQLGGLDEDFEVAFNDVDLCVRIGLAGYRIVWTPYAEAYHYESKSRGYEDDKKKIKRFETETQRFLDRHSDILAKGDPYYNPNLTLEREDFGLR